MRMACLPERASRILAIGHTKETIIAGFDFYFDVFIDAVATSVRAEAFDFAQDRLRGAGAKSKRPPGRTSTSPLRGYAQCERKKLKASDENGPADGRHERIQRAPASRRK
jgi:hypothetical protein